jgi:hypothetical protein
MENAMKNTILRILISAILLLLISGIAVSHRHDSRVENFHPIQQWLFLGQIHHDLTRVSKRYRGAQPTHFWVDDQPVGDPFGYR